MTNVKTNFAAQTIYVGLDVHNRLLWAVFILIRIQILTCPSKPILFSSFEF